MQIKRMALVLLAVIGLSAGILAVQDPSLALAASAKDEVCAGIGAAANTNEGCSNPAGSPTLQGLVHTIVNLLSIIVGIIAVIMLIYGGFRYVTSAGDSGKIANAKTTIIYALVGVAVAAVAQFLVQFVLDSVTK